MERDRFIHFQLFRRKKRTSGPSDSPTSDEYPAIEASPEHREIPPTICEWDANIAQQQHPRTTKSTPPMCISLTDSESEDHESDAHKDGIETHKKNFRIKKQKSAGIKATTTRQVCMSIYRCKETFESWDEMMYHLERYHANGIIRSYQCYLCKKLCSRPLDLTRHIQSVHTGLKPFQCQTCLRRFGAKGSLKVHINRIHAGERIFQCPNQLCLRWFDSKASLVIHIDSLHSNMSSPVHMFGWIVFGDFYWEYLSQETHEFVTLGTRVSSYSGAQTSTCSFYIYILYVGDLPSFISTIYKFFAGVIHAAATAAAK